MAREVLEGRFLGAGRTCGHVMAPTGPGALLRYRSACGLFWTDRLWAAGPDVPDCRQCARRPEGRRS